MVFNLFGVAEPRGGIPVVRGTPGHISAQESSNVLSTLAFVQLLAEPLNCAGGTLTFRGTPVEKPLK